MGSGMDKLKLKIKTLSCSHFLHYESLGKQSSSRANSLIWPKVHLIQDFIPILITFIYDDDSIKSEGAIMSTALFSGAQGRIIIRFGPNSNMSEI